MYQTKITSQGTISLPAALRQKYGLKIGEVVTLEDNGKITIVKNPDFNTLREQNKKYLTPNSAGYQNGDGLTAHAQEHYGKQ